MNIIKIEKLTLSHIRTTDIKMKKTCTLHIKVDQTKRPNKLHLEIQQHNKAQVFRNRKKYTRKRKHKSLDN